MTDINKKKIHESLLEWARSKQHMETLLIAGLLTDGGHHKQATLEEVLKHLVGEVRYNQLKAQYDWEEGIPG